MLLNKPFEEWINGFPLFEDIIPYREVLWQSPALLPSAEALRAMPCSREDMEDAARRLERFRPLIRTLFPETAAADGLIESELREIPAMAGALGHRGTLLIKLDSDLPIAGSVKARGHL